MFIKCEISNFNELYDMCWSGAIERLDKVSEKGLEDELMQLLDDVFGDEIPEDVELNDFIWFDLENYEPFDKLYNEDDEDDGDDEDE